MRNEPDPNSYYGINEGWYYLISQSGNVTEYRVVAFFEGAPYIYYTATATETAGQPGEPGQPGQPGPLVQLYFPLNHGDFKNYEWTSGTIHYTSTLSYSLVFYQDSLSYLEEDSLDGSQAYYGYAGSELQMYGMSSGGVNVSFQTPLTILNDSILSDGGTLSSSTTLDYEGDTIILNVTVTSNIVDSVSIPLGKVDDLRLIDTTFSYTAPGESGTYELKDAWLLAPRIGKLKIAALDWDFKTLGWFIITDGQVNGESIVDIINSPAF